MVPPRTLLAATAPLPLLLLLVIPLVEGCASAPAPRHGKPSALSRGGPGMGPGEKRERCPHGVPPNVCVLCHPDLRARFEAAGDWCGPHGVPESQCFVCHPDLTFDAPVEAPPGADVAHLSRAGEDVAALAAHAVAGKVTIFDFYADWCVPCRKIDAHVFSLMAKRADLAVRKLNVVSWESPLSRHHLADVSGLPYVVVYGRDQKLVRAIAGLDIASLDAAIAEGAAR